MPEIDKNNAIAQENKETGEDDQIAQSLAELEKIEKDLEKTMPPDSPMLAMAKEHIGVLRSLYTVPEQATHYRQVLPIAEFQDDDMAYAFVKAIWEDLRYGMDIGFDYDYMLAKLGVNTSSMRTNRANLVVDGVTHRKVTTYYKPEKGKDGHKFSRSPIGES